MIYLLVLTLVSIQSALAYANGPSKVPTRPALVQDAIAAGHDLYYFGLGSNMLRSKIENRGVNGSKIELLSIEPAVVQGHRLAFNVRGFPPLEPAMGGLEPCSSPSRPLNKYSEDECHGALVLLTSENFEKVMRSEGVGDDVPNPGYEEVVVDAYPYNSPNSPVKAIALRARPHVRLSRDSAPSQRYMNILREGADELGLIPCYQEFLAEHPVQFVPIWLRRLAVYNLIFTITLSTKLKTRFFSRAQSCVLFLFHQPKAGEKAERFIFNAMNAAVLLPGAFLGGTIKSYHSLTKKELPGMIPRLITMMDEPSKAK